MSINRRCGAAAVFVGIGDSRFMRFYGFVWIICLAWWGCSPVGAQTERAEPEKSAQERAVDEKNMQEIIIEAVEKPTNELGSSAFELKGDELITKLGATLGETLADEPGVHNASYGPGVGLPVLRGLSGVRIRLSEDGIGAWDASSISPDHATAIEPVIANSIQVIKGPATVLHGNNAIGGTVEVTHGRIAEELSEKAVSLVLEQRKELENEHQRESYVGKFRTEVGKMVLQLDGFVRESDDMSIPGLAIQEQAIGEVFGIFDSDNTFGTVINTDADSNSGSLALSYVNDSFFIGAASTTLKNEYGIPPGAHTEPADSPGHSHSHPVGDNIAIQPRVRIDLNQKRHLLKFGQQLDGQYFDSYRFTIGNVEYSHREFERNVETGEVFGGTRFLNDVVEIKAELDHALFQFLNSRHAGKMGLQWVDREFLAESERVVGGEDFIPETTQQALGLFFYEDFPVSIGKVEVGGRYEWQEVVQQEPTTPLTPIDLRFMHAPITYQTYTLSSALTYDLAHEHAFIFSLNAAQRAPEIQELLSFGPHLATRSFDIGLLFAAGRESLPKPEKFYGIETRWEWSGLIGDMTSTLFYTEAHDFVYQEKREVNGLFDLADLVFRSTCVRLEECIAIFDYTQSDVTLSGYEWQWLLPPVGLFNGEFQLEVFADYVRGKISDGRDLPRMPPRRQGLGLQWGNNEFNAELRYSHVSAQNKPGENETSTNAYDLLNARFSYTHHIDDASHQDLMAFLQMKNLLDEEIRKSTSFLRNFTPEPGREIMFGLRYQF